MVILLFFTPSSCSCCVMAAPYTSRYEASGDVDGVGGATLGQVRTMVLSYSALACSGKEFAGFFRETLKRVGYSVEQVAWMARRSSVSGVDTGVCFVLVSLPYRTHGRCTALDWRLGPEQVCPELVSSRSVGSTAFGFVVRVLLTWSVELLDAVEGHGFVFFGPGFNSIGVDARGFLLGEEWVKC